MPWTADNPLVDTIYPIVRTSIYKLRHGMIQSAQDVLYSNIDTIINKCNIWPADNLRPLVGIIISSGSACKIKLYHEMTQLAQVVLHKMLILINNK